jgi:hypothetical protein
VTSRATKFAAACIALLAALLAVVACAGCDSAPAQPARPSEQACIQFGIRAIRHHVMVRTLPPACRGLTRQQVDFAVAAAIHATTSGVRGKAASRRRAAEVTPLLEHLVTSVPPQPAAPPVVAPAVASAKQASPTPLRLLALCSWLATVGLGSWMLSRWISRRIIKGALRRATGPHQDAGLSPWVSFTHFGLAVAGLLAWIGYLASDVTIVGWLSCAALLPTAGLGMSLVFLGSGRRPTPVVAAHITLAVTTILLTLLAVVGS